MRTRTPLLHELVSCVQAPTVALSGSEDRFAPTGPTGFSIVIAGSCPSSVVDVDGHEPVAVGHGLSGPAWVGSWGSFAILGTRAPIRPCGSSALGVRGLTGSTTALLVNV